MKLHREGKNVLWISGCIFLLLVIITVLLSFPLIIKSIILFPFLVLYLLIVWFFRVPGREINRGKKTTLAPADGKIVAIEKCFENEYFQDERIQISIFMSPLNIHVNTYPVDGKVVYTKYHQGKYLVAWHPKSSFDNERSTTVIENGNYKILIRQIAGAVARRIITYAREDTTVKQGEELGFIRFGSRVDVFVPTNSEICCTLNDKVKSQVTPIAILK